MAVKEYVLKADGVILPHPSKYVVGYETVDYDSGRNANGNLIRNVVNQKIKIETAFPMMTDETAFRTLIRTTLKTSISLEYYDISSDSYKTIKCYCGASKPEIDHIEKGRITFKEFSINWIEY